MRKLQIFVPQVSDLFFLRNTRDAAISCKQYDSATEPEIYFYADRHSATGYIYTYRLMEPQRFAGQMQREMMREIEAARPKYLVFVVVPTSWLRWRNSETEIFDWFDRYAAADFRLDGLVNIVSRDRTDYYLPLSVDPGSIRLSKYYLLIFKRKT